MDHVEKPTRWSLKDLLAEPVEQALEETFSKLEQALVEFEAMRDVLTSEITWQDFNNVLKMGYGGHRDLADGVIGHNKREFFAPSEHQRILGDHDRLVRRAHG